MLLYDEIIHKIKAGDVRQTDKAGNNLLHHLLAQEEFHPISVEPVQSLLEQEPSLARRYNKRGDLPTDILDRVQPDDRISNRPLRRLLYPLLPDGDKKEFFRRTFQTSFIEYQGRVTSDFDYLPADKLTEKPAILCFSGRGGFSPGFVTGVAKVVFDSLGLEGQNTDSFRFLGVKYPGSNWDLCQDYRVSHDALPIPLPTDHPYHYIRDFVTDYLHPLYTDDKEHKISPIQAAKNLQSFILMGYSYGGSVLHHISQAMNADMRHLHYSAKEVSLIQSQIPALIIGPSISADSYTNGFKCYHLLSTYDNIVFERVKPLLVKMPKKDDLFIQTTLKKQSNQQVFLINDQSSTTYPTHHIKSYTAQNSPVYQLANLWKNFMLFNALNHALASRQTTAFLPLPDALTVVPDKLSFVKKKSILSHHQKSAQRLKYDQTVRTRV